VREKEEVAVMVTLQIYMREVLGSDVGRDTPYCEIVVVFLCLFR
jgi:hypothetical protein